MKKSIPYIFLLLILGLAACRQYPHIRFLLQEAETLMPDRPDSSLILLESVRFPEKLSSEDDATWCLYGYQDLAGRALKSYQKACQYAVQSGDSSCLSYAYSYMGRAYGIQKDWKYEQLEKESMLEKEKRTPKIQFLVAAFLLLCIVIAYQRRLFKKDKEIQVSKKELNCFIEESEQNKRSIDQNQQKIHNLTSQLEEKRQKLADTDRLEDENRSLKQRNEKLQKEIQRKFILLSTQSKEFAAYKRKMIFAFVV